MTLKVVGAGLGRTGTHSLKIALEQLLGAPCYHMLEVFEHPEHVPEWHRAIQGETPNWATIFAGYAAAVDWPTGAFYEPLSALPFRSKARPRASASTVHAAEIPAPSQPISAAVAPSPPVSPL